MLSRTYSHSAHWLVDLSCRQLHTQALAKLHCRWSFKTCYRQMSNIINSSPILLLVLQTILDLRLVSLVLVSALLCPETSAPSSFFWLPTHLPLPGDSRPTSPTHPALLPPSSSSTTRPFASRLRLGHVTLQHSRVTTVDDDVVEHGPAPDLRHVILKIVDLISTKLPICMCQVLVSWPRLPAVATFHTCSR